MHNNYYLLRQLAQDLTATLKGARLITCYSQDKDELTLGLVRGNLDFFIHAVLRPDLSVLHFPKELHRARKNTVDLFPQVMNNSVAEVVCYENERCLSIQMQGGWELIFKMFGHQSNALLCHNSSTVEVFKNQLSKDLDVIPNQLHRKIDITWERFVTCQGDLVQFLPTLGSPVKQHLAKQGYAQAVLEQKWNLLQEVLAQLKRPEYYIQWKDELPVLTMFETGEHFYHSAEVRQALNEFFYHFVTKKGLLEVRNKLIQLVTKRLKRSKKHLLRLHQRIAQIENQVPYQTIADMIMAYMHQIPKGATTAELPHFDTNELISIKLKATFSPQKNAEYYYRKSKNQKKELTILKKNLNAISQEIEKNQQNLEFVTLSDNVKELRTFSKTHELVKTRQPTAAEDLFKSYVVMGFTILVGRNAANNDLLTQRYAHKEDLWLHAKDVKGSHVVIKNQPGKPFPLPVIERAAGLAAYYSKRKHDTLCPVTYTPKKFVRKPKGSPPGQVLVEKEQVILIEPASD